MDTFLKHLAEGINAPDLVIEADARLLDIPNWDSLAILTTLSMVDMEYGVTLSGTELQNCETVDELYRIVMHKKGSSL